MIILTLKARVDLQGFKCTQLTTYNVLISISVFHFLIRLARFYMQAIVMPLFGERIIHFLLGLTLLLTYVQSIYFNRSQQLGVRTSNLMTQEVPKLAKPNENFLTVTGMLKLLF